MWLWRILPRTFLEIWDLVPPCLASIMPKRKRNFYAVKCGRNPGVYENWEDCKRQVDGFQGNEYKAFSIRSDAEDYIKGSVKCSQISNSEQDRCQSPKISTFPQCESFPTHSEAEKYVEEFVKFSQTSATLKQANSQSLPVSPSSQSEPLELIEEHGERFVVFDSIKDFDMYFDFLGRSRNENNEKERKRLFTSKEFQRDREEQMHARDRSALSKDSTSASSAKLAKAQQKAHHEITKLTREDGEFVHFKDEHELESYLAPYFNDDGRVDSVEHSLVSQTFNGAELGESDGVYQIEFDGASKGNPGKSGAGALIRCPHGSVVLKQMEFLGTATNNVAEYRALILGLKGAVSKGVGKVRVQGDSKLVCLQVLGVWEVRDEKLIPLCNAVKELKKCFEEFSIIHVEREFNSTADALANNAVRLGGSELMREIIEPIPKCCKN